MNTIPDTTRDAVDRHARALVAALTDAVGDRHRIADLIAAEADHPRAALILATALHDVFAAMTPDPDRPSTFRL